MSRLTGPVPKEIFDKIDIECSFMYPGSEFMPEVRNMMWDGCRHLFSTKTGMFPTGLTSRVKKIIEDSGMSVEVIPPSIEPVYISVGEFVLDVRDYQDQALEAIRNNRIGVVRSPTGSGKTEIVCGTIYEKKVPTFILVHRKELLYQMQERIKKRLGIQAGIVGDGHEEYSDVCVGMVQTLMHALGIVSKDKLTKDNTVLLHKECLSKYQLLIADEVHMIGASVFYKVSKAFNNTLYRYGFSATPTLREDSPLLVEAAFGPLIFSKTISDLKGKYLADVDLYFIQFKHGKVNRALRYPDLYKIEVINNISRNKLIVDLVDKCGDKRVLIAVRNIEHGKILEKLISGSVFVHGSMKGAERAKYMNMLENKSIRRIIATAVWEQGVDIPSLEVLIDTRAEKSAIAFVQLVGRVMRKTDLKNRAIVLDIFDTGCRWLSTHSQDRLDIATREIGEVNFVKSF